MNKALKIIKKIALALLALFIISCMVVGIICAIVRYQEKQSHYTSKRLSEDVAVHCFYYRKGRLSIYNDLTGKYTAKDIDWVTCANPADTFSVFSRNGKRGYISTLDGNIIIPEQYEKAWIFSDGVAAAMKDGKIGFINSKNEIVLPFKFDYAEGVSYVFKDGLCTMSDENRACGLIDTKGNWVLTPQFDCIWAPDDNNLRLVADNGKFGLMDSSFGLPFPIEYDWISTLRDGNYHMVKDGIKRKVSPNGSILQDFVVDHTWALKYPVRIEAKISEDMWGDPELIEEVANTLSDYIGYRIDFGEEEAFGVIHAHTGEIVFPAKYKDVRMGSDRLFEVEDLHDRTSMLIDIEGNIIQTSRK